MEVRLSNHAVDRFVQRFAGHNFDEVYGRACRVHHCVLNAEAVATGRTARFRSADLYYRDDVTGCVFVLHPVGDDWLIVTTYRFRKPKVMKPRAKHKPKGGGR